MIGFLSTMERMAASSNDGPADVAPVAAGQRAGRLHLVGRSLPVVGGRDRVFLFGQSTLRAVL